MVSTRRKPVSRGYQVGDKVEVVRPSGVESGTLISKKKATVAASPQSGRSDDGSSPVNHWTVSITTVDPNTTGTSVAQLEEDISEHMFGRILLANANQVSGSSSDTSVTAASLTSPTTDNTKSAIAATSSCSTTKQHKLAQPPKKKSQTVKPTHVTRRGMAHNHHLPVASTTTRNGQPTTQPVVPTANAVVQRSHTRSSGDAELLSGVTVASAHGSHCPAIKKSSLKANLAYTYSAADAHHGILTTRNGLSVTKIPMHTGTLYIYTGTRQAEFVRTK